MRSLATLAAVVLPINLIFTSLGAAPEAEIIEFSAETVVKAPQRQVARGKMYIGKDGTRKESERDGKKIIQITNHRDRVAWILFPDEKSYLERRGGAAPPATQTQKSGAVDPCAGAPQSVTCRKAGSEMVHGRETDKWEIVTQKQGQTQSTVMWIDKERGFPIKQQFPDGSSEFRLIGKETINGRETEKWEITQIRKPTQQSQQRQPSQQQGPQTTRSVQWYDPKLDLAIREEYPGGYVRELTNIQVGPQSASLFELPQGYTKKQMPTQRKGDQRRGQPAYPQQQRGQGGNSAPGTYPNR
jgi:hypothetical protein